MGDKESLDVHKSYPMCHNFLLLCFPLGQQPNWSKQTVVLSASISNGLLVHLYCHSWIRNTTVSGYTYFNFNFNNKFWYLETVATNSLRNNIIDFGVLQDGTLLLLFKLQSHIHTQYSACDVSFAWTFSDSAFCTVIKRYVDGNIRKQSSS